MDVRSSHSLQKEGSIPHGSSLLAQGIAQHFSGPPALKPPPTECAFSEFPSFNSTPFLTLPTSPPILHAAGSAETLRVRPKTVFLVPRPPKANDRVSQVDEGQIVASINFKANLQTAE